MAKRPEAGHDGRETGRRTSLAFLKAVVLSMPAITTTLLTTRLALRVALRAAARTAALLALMTTALTACDATRRTSGPAPEELGGGPVALGPRPFYLIDRMPTGPLRERLAACRSGPFRRTRFSIGHRGAPLQFPEHTRESYLAAARMGAGTIECDVTATRDQQLFCRHAACDLASTTNILETPLAERCREPFRPALFDPESGELVRPADALCCTVDLTLAELRRLEGRMDATDPTATTLAAYLDATPAYRTDLYANGATLMSHDESLRLFSELGVTMTPELKSPAPVAPDSGDSDDPSYSGKGYSGKGDSGKGNSGKREEIDRRARALQLLAAYQRAEISPSQVRLQSFDLGDLRVWLEADPEFGAQAIWLVDRVPSPLPTVAEFRALHDEGLRTIGAATRMLLRVGEDGELRASEYAARARAAGLELIAWTLERSGRIRAGTVEGRAQDFYLDPVLPVLEDDGDVYRVIHALATEVGVIGVFSDWPATITYYANCFGLD